MRELSDESLIETYMKALHLKLDEEFIKLLEQEIARRRLSLDESAAEALN